MITRILEKELRKVPDGYGVISVTGPRQSGKTTLVKEVFKNFEYFNLELPNVRQYAESDPRSFLNQARGMVIDEVQYVPELLSYIQGIVDQDRNRKFVITGSQNLLVSEKITQSLAGRVSVFNLLTLSREELGDLGGSLTEQVYRGFYPKLYTEKLDPTEWLGDYIQTYLERDVRQIKNVENLSTFQKFMGLLAGRTGQVLNTTALANDVGVSVPTISGWISILEASFVVYRLQPYYKSWNKRLTKAPKIHFLDSGLVCALLGIKNGAELAKHPLWGYIFESMVVSELYKNKSNRRTRDGFYYWREKNGMEIDLMIDDGKKLRAYEIKAGTTFSGDQVKGLLYYEKIAKEPVGLELVCGGDESQERTGYKVRSWRDLRLSD